MNTLASGNHTMSPSELVSDLEKAMSLHQEGELQGAEALYRRILSSEPRHFTALHCLGVMKNQCGDFEEGARILGEALRVNSRSALGHMNLGIALWNLNRPDEALSHYQLSLLLNPSNTDALLNRAAALHHLGRHNEALESLDQLLSMAPNSIDGHMNRSIVLRGLGRWEESIASLDAVLGLKPDWAEAHIAMGDTLAGLGLKREAIQSYVTALSTAPQPHLVNELINTLESELGLDELVSFPPQVFLNLNKLCNAKCLFCHIPDMKNGFKDAIEPADLERMTWLRYVSDLALVGGFGESLINPYFKENLALLRSNHPHLKLCLWTNGISITDELCPLFVDSLSSLVVSLNAATTPSWEKVMGGTKGFERICKHLKTISQMKIARGSASPKMSISTVLIKDNAHELPAMVELAKELGIDEVIVQHYSTHQPTTGRTAAPPSSSMYQERELCDHYLAEASKRAMELGIQVSFPLPFATEPHQIEAGSRVNHAPSSCSAPWRALLLFDELEPGLRQASVCCTGPFYLALYRKEGLTEAGLRETWNHPNLRFLRKTIRGRGSNPVCDWCQSSDRFDPADPQWDGVRKSVEPIFRHLDISYRAGTAVTPDDVVTAMKAAHSFQ